MNDADRLELEIMEKAQKLAAMRRAEAPVEVRDYAFATLDGETHLSRLFGDRDRLLAIHNMGQGCRYCTLWADGVNGVLPHLEDAMAVVLLSKDPPELQRRLAQDRGWRFRMASHGGGAYMTEQSIGGDGTTHPGAVVYERRGDKVFRRGRAAFGPGDVYCAVWHLLALGGIGADDWTPQFHYWKRPKKMDDGGADLID